MTNFDKQLEAVCRDATELGFIRGLSHAATIASDAGNTKIAHEILTSAKTALQFRAVKMPVEAAHGDA